MRAVGDRGDPAVRYRSRCAVVLIGDLWRALRRVFFHSLRASLNGSRPRFSHHKYSSPERWSSQCWLRQAGTVKDSGK
jgi:hypothetical protein